MKAIVKARKISINGKFYYFGEKVTISEKEINKYSDLVEFEKENTNKTNKINKKHK